MTPMAEPFAIAIDGPVASGKSTVGRRAAELLGFRFLDTGLMYRAVGWSALGRGVALDDEDALAALAEGMAFDFMQQEGEHRVRVGGEDVTERLHDHPVSGAASAVAAIPGVRRALVARQRAISLLGPIVMVGRDIGTVVLVDAPVKVYLTASVEVRAERRHRELGAAGETVGYRQVVSDLIRRDKMDSERDDSPLRPAEGAVMLASDGLSVDELAREIAGAAARAGWKS